MMITLKTAGTRILTGAGALFVFAVGSLEGQDADHLKLDSPFASFVEEGFPFFTQTLDSRKLGEEWPKDNLTQRGVIIKLGRGYFACFDIDLLRIALIWKENKKGEYLTMSGMAPGSYRLPNRKASAGQQQLPVPLGTPLAATGKYPGWMIGKAPKKGYPKDRRKRSVDAEESGLGPAPGLRWLGIRRHANDLALEYRCGGAKIVERITLHPEKDAVIRRISLPQLDETITMVNPSQNGEPGFVEFSPDQSKSIFACAVWGDSAGVVLDAAHGWEKPRRDLTWKKTITTKLKTTETDNGLKIDEAGLPLANPWKRNVRLSAFAFFENGDAAISTFDGDVWIVSGLSGDLNEVNWRRFASGLHEPIGLEIVADQIYVFSRNGIIRLHDTSASGEADFYENFSSVVPQTAETREFANDIVTKPGGGFYLAKGGQVSSTRGIANGTVVALSADGTSYETVVTGLRMPYIGVDPKTGIITASDQQGNWKPATPLHVVRPGEYYGFQPAKFKEKAVHPATIDEPEIWLPHFVNQSGASQIWLRDARMGVLNDRLVHIGYNRPELFQIYLEEAGGKIIQGAAASLTSRFPSGLLKGKVHPVDGSLWLTGFKIWGTAAQQISGLYRVTPSGDPVWTPAELKSAQRGVLLCFHQEVDPTIASALSSYSADRWNYLRSHNYGSGHYRLDGTPGQESLPVASVQISTDRKSIFLGIPDMKPCHSLRVTYKIPATGDSRVGNAYFTIHELSQVDLRKRGFSGNDVNLTVSPEMLSQAADVKPTVQLGKESSVKYGCIACHAAGDHVPPAVAVDADGAQVTVGPPWNGLWNSKRKFSDGTELKKADEVYFRESILDPARKVTEGYETEKTGVGMPSYLGVLKDYEVDSIILYIKSLHKVKTKR